MKEFIKYVYIEPFEDNGIWGFILGLFSWLITLIVLFGVYSGCYYVIDYVSTKENTGVSVVIDKEYIPSYTTTTYMYTGKILVPMITHHNEKNIIYVEINNKYSSVDVSYKIYANTQIGDTLVVDYSIGRLSNNIKINNIYK